MVEASPANILIVDDDEFNLKLLSIMLSAQGHAVRTAPDGLAALDAVAAQLPDLILLDVMMPGIDGFEVLRRLKADVATRTIPVALITALEDNDSRSKGLAAGAAAFLNKPVNRLELQTQVNTLLGI